MKEKEIRDGGVFHPNSTESITIEERMLIKLKVQAYPFPMDLSWFYIQKIYGV